MYAASVHSTVIIGQGPETRAPVREVEPGRDCEASVAGDNYELVAGRHHHPEVAGTVLHRIRVRAWVQESLQKEHQLSKSRPRAGAQSWGLQVKGSRSNPEGIELLSNGRMDVSGQHSAASRSWQQAGSCRHLKGLTCGFMKKGASYSL